MLEGLCVGLDPLIPHPDFVVAPPQFAVDLAQIHHHARVLLQVGDSLTVVGSCAFVFHLGLLAVRHEEAPFSLSANVDEAILFFVMVQEILKVIDLILFYKVEGNIEVLFDKETRITVCVLVSFLRSVR